MQSVLGFKVNCMKLVEATGRQKVFQTIHFWKYVTYGDIRRDY